jgi:hypothetical protein
MRMPVMHSCAVYALLMCIRYPLPSLHGPGSHGSTSLQLCSGSDADPHTTPCCAACPQQQQQQQPGQAPPPPPPAEEEKKEEDKFKAFAGKGYSLKG